MADLTRTITIVSKFRDEGLARARRAVNNVGKAAKNLGDRVAGTSEENKKFRSGVAKTAEQVEKFRSAMGGLGDTFGDITGGLDDLATLLEQGLSPMAAFGAGALVAAAAVVSFASGVASTVSEIDELEKSLRTRGDPALNEAAASVKHLNNEVEELSQEWDAQWVFITARLAPALEGLVETLDTLLPPLVSAGGAVVTLTREFTALGGVLGTIGEGLAIVGQADELMEAADASERMGQSVTDLDTTLVATKDAFGLYEQSAYDAVDALRETSNAEHDVAVALVRSRQEAEKREAQAQRHARQEADRQRRRMQQVEQEQEAREKALRANQEASQRAADEQVEIDRDRANRMLENKRMEAENIAAEQRDMFSSQTQMDADYYAQRTQLAQDSAMQVLNVTSTLIDAVGRLVDVQLQNEINSARKGSLEQRKAALKAFNTRKALALTQIAIDTAMSSINMLATATYPANIVLAALATAAGIAAGAAVAAQKPPSFNHRGTPRLAPDEIASASGNTVTRQNEVGAVFTRQGTAAFEGAMNMLNRGQSPSSGDTYLVIPDGTAARIMHTHAEPNPAVGQRVRQ